MVVFGMCSIDDSNKLAKLNFEGDKCTQTIMSSSVKKETLVGCHIMNSDLILAFYEESVISYDSFLNEIKRIEWTEILQVRQTFLKEIVACHKNSSQTGLIGVF